MVKKNGVITIDLSHFLQLDASLKFKAGERFRDLCELLGLECHIENLCHLLGNGSMSCQWIFQQSGFYCKCPIMAVSITLFMEVRVREGGRGELDASCFRDSTVDQGKAR